MKKLVSPARGVIAAALLVAMIVPAQAQLKEVLNTGEQATRRAEQIQEQINQLDDQRTDQVREYRSLLQRRDAAELYAKQQELVVKTQRDEIASLTEQVGSIDEIKGQTTPMLLGMITDLKAFVAADLPFKKTEREARLQALDGAMANPAVSEAERYRLIIDAYQAEMEYGRTIDSWSEEITLGGKPTTVKMFTYGRVSYVYLAPNGKAARFDRATGEWKDVDGGMAREIEKAIRIAEGKTQPTVLFAPVQKFAVK